MKISALNESYKVASSARKANVSFGSAASTAASSAAKVGGKAAKTVKLHWFVDLLEWAKNSSEKSTILATAIGTAFVAPIFIAFNPFSKEDKDTKTYSAARQPISAIITVFTQIFINNKFNRWLDRLASTAKDGRFKDIDLSKKPSASYLKQEIKHANPYMDNKKVMEQVKQKQNNVLYSYIDDERKRLMGKDPKELEAFIKSKANENAETLAKDPKYIQAKKDLEYFTYEKMIGLEDYKAAREEIELEIKHNGKNLSKKQLKASIKAETTEEKVKERAIKIVERKVEAETKSKWETARAIKSGTKIEDLLVDSKSKKGAIENEIKAAKESGNHIIIELKEQLDVVNKRIEKLEKDGINTSKKYVGKTYEDALKMVKIKKYINGTLSFAEERLSKMKSWGGIIVSLATLPFTCGLLNWAYPRLMEKFMPEVSKSKKTKEAK